MWQIAQQSEHSRRIDTGGLRRGVEAGHKNLLPWEKVAAKQPDEGMRRAGNRATLNSERSKFRTRAAIGVGETKRNLNNKISRGGFSAVFLLQCLDAIGSESVHLR